MFTALDFNTRGKLFFFERQNMELKENIKQTSGPELLTRREMMTFLLGGVAALLPAVSSADTGQKRRLYEMDDRYRGFDKSVPLRISRADRDKAPLTPRDHFDGFYMDRGVLVPDAYNQLCYIFRDWRLGERAGVAQIDLNLINLLAAMQMHLDKETGRQTRFILNSGYRSPQTNSRIEGAAKDSFHMRGMAADVTVPGVSVSYLNKLAVYFQTGGVGIYRRKNFVHVDSGRFRQWSGA